MMLLVQIKPENQKYYSIEFQILELLTDNSLYIKSSVGTRLLLAWRRPPVVTKVTTNGSVLKREIIRSMFSKKFEDIFILSCLNNPVLFIQFDHTEVDQCIDHLLSSLSIKRSDNVFKIIEFSPLISNKVLGTYNLEYKVANLLLMLLTSVYQYHEITNKALEYICQQSHLFGSIVYDVMEQMYYIRRRPFEEFIAHFDRVYSMKLPTLSNSDSDKSIKLVFTPTTVFCEPLYSKFTNRIVRKYSQGNSELFIRVQFIGDDGKELRNTSEKFQKYMKILLIKKGINIANKCYKFLGYSNSQMRDYCCWVANSKAISIESIFRNFGKIHEKSIAKYASRYAQCFTTTIDTINSKEMKVIEKTEDDIIRNGYNFTDGIGKISPQLMNAVILRFYRDNSEMLGNAKANINLYKYASTAIQFRYKGAKGILAVFPFLNGLQIILRKSQIKFESDDHIIEVIDDSQFHYGYLNRQVIYLLSAREVSNDKIIAIQREYIDTLLNIRNDKYPINDILNFIRAHLFKPVFDIIQKMYARLKTFQEPFIEKCLQVMSDEGLNIVKSKTRILVSKSANLIGVTDELSTLQYGEVFCQIENTVSKTLKVIEGDVFVVKNPALYPSDIRVLKAVDKKELHFYYNVVVFPQKGKRPHPNEISGSDLDGDKYFITWDSRIIPKSDAVPPEFKSSPSTSEDFHEASLSQILESMISFHENSCIGLIANNHMKIAEHSFFGANDPLCIQLAEQHSIEVDAAKSGKHGRISKEVQQYIKDEYKLPDYMREGVEEPDNVPHSIVGQLYWDCVKYSSNTCKNESNLILNPSFVIKGYEMYLEDATWLYNEYAYKLGILMKMFKSTEMQLLSIFVCVSNKLKSRDYDDMNEKRKTAVYKFIRKFRSRFSRMNAELVLFASACYVVAYTKKELLSFPWVIGCDELLCL